MKNENRRVLNDADIETLERLLKDLKYGSITLIVQDGKIVQIDRNEKYRIKD